MKLRWPSTDETPKPLLRGACASPLRAPPRLRLQILLHRTILGTSLALLVLSATRSLAAPIDSDAYAYWASWTGELYGGSLGDPHAYLYSPAFAQAIWPLTLLSYSAFYALWFGCNLAALVYLVGWRLAGFVALLFYPVFLEIGNGNIHLFIAVAIALGYRYSAAWAFVLLTKVTPGVGLAWFAVRRDWRALGTALGVTAVIILISALIAPALWSEWGQLMVAGSIDTPAWAVVDLPLSIRLLIALGLVIVGAWRGWRWIVPVSAILALPAVWLSSVVIMLSEAPGKSLPQRVRYLMILTVVWAVVAVGSRLLGLTVAG